MDKWLHLSEWKMSYNKIMRFRAACVLDKNTCWFVINASRLYFLFRSVMHNSYGTEVKRWRMPVILAAVNSGNRHTTVCNESIKRL